MTNAAVATALCLLIGYPIALGIARADPAWQSLLLMLVILPFWTSFLLRVYAWMGLLGTNSWFNRLLTGAWNGVVPPSWEVPHLPLMNSNFAVVLVTVYSYLPFMILPLYATLEKVDRTLDEAAMDLGSRPTRVFRDVTLPLSIPGIVAGGLPVFIPACDELIIPSLVGDASRPMDDLTHHQRRVHHGAQLAHGLGRRGGTPGAARRAPDGLRLGRGTRRRGGPAGASAMRRKPHFVRAMLVFGLAFFYVPILSMIVFSFNDSRLATVWGGFSTQWYGQLVRNDQIIEAALLSIRVALVSATAATILGTMAGIPLARVKRFRGRTVFSGLVTAPLVMPEVITGNASLMHFILVAQWIGWPGQRGFTTVTLAHITLSMDESIEEAAIDLGSEPWQVLRDVTLPVIWPAILAGWLLAFTISLYEVVITSFTTGPGYTTLPILIWSKVKLGVTPNINALATITVLAVGLGVLVAGLVMSRAGKRRQRDTVLAVRENA